MSEQGKLMNQLPPTGFRDLVTSVNTKNELQTPAQAQSTITETSSPPSTQSEEPDTPTHGASSISPTFRYNALLHPVDTNPHYGHPTIATHRASPLSAELRVQTDLWNTELEAAPVTVPGSPVTEVLREKKSPSSCSLPVRTPSIKSALHATHYTGGSVSPTSVISSPGLGPLEAITPLPSPLTATASASPWRRRSNAAEISPPSSNYEPSPANTDGELSLLDRTSPKKRKAYPGLTSGYPAVHPHAIDPHILAANAASHAKNRSISEYVPDGLPPTRARVIAVSGTQTPTSTISPSDPSMHREESFALQRGLAYLPTPRPPTPPRNNQSITRNGDFESPPPSPRFRIRPSLIQYEARTIRSGKLRQWTSIRKLGEGAFSTVMLATSENIDSRLFKDGALEAEKAEQSLDPRSLVAVKICEHGPAGGVDEKKIESSLKRELEILKSIHHPSLVHLKAVNVLDIRAFLILNYCAGGDLFELASTKLEILTPNLIRRIFAELVGAVRYLHDKYIVHRDIKLENVLLTLPSSQLPSLPCSPLAHPTPLITLTDLGLSRYIPQPPESPLLTTRCGSEDYAAPELLMGQEYDGRCIDAWALGVLLYALMEGRLPFDVVPGGRKRVSPVSHRIARVEWRWVKYGDDDGEWDPEKGREMEGAREVVEGLLKRVKHRWSLEKVAETQWVKGGILVENGLWVEEEVEGDD
ncbi:MAG: hypothetical protein MMC33_002005 [Icmadophila ericetorum]|nr:hypothetical protein [Icmadophila ericetorum]